MKNTTRKLLALTMAFAVGFGGAHGLMALNRTAAAEGGTTYAEPVEDTSPALYVTEKNMNSVVGVITNDQTWTRSEGVINQQIAQGSGVVIAEGGYVLTNNHVIEDGSAFQILMPSGEKVDATLVGADSATDLAVLQVMDDADQLVPVTFGSLDNLKVGSTVIAIGNPGGEVLANTVTQGIVSALERTSVNSSNTSRRINYIQHDAAINSGNSGGGLFNFKGELVGINTLKYSGSAYSSFEGLGFAIPIDTVTKISSQLMADGKVTRPGLGITAASYEGPDQPLNNNPPASVCVRTVNQGGAAEKAGIQQYDFIIEADGQRITSMLDLTGVIDEHEAGDTIEVKVVRYNQVGIMQNTYNNNPYGGMFGFGFGFGYGNDSGNSSGGTFYAQGGYEEYTYNVTLEVIE